MYNSTIKQRFISEFTTKLAYRRTCEVLFDTTAKYEEEAQCDLCAMNAEQIAPIAERMETLRSGNSRLRTNILKHYSTWCMKNGVPGANDAIYRVETSNITKIKRKMIGYPIQLQRYLNLAMNDESEKTPDTIYRCIFWMAYAGISIDDVDKITAEHVHFDDMLIVYNGKNYPIYREGFSAVKTCATATQFLYHNPTYTANFSMRDRVPGESLIRGILKIPSKHSIMAEISKFSRIAASTGQTETRLTYYSTMLSGLFYRMYEREIAGVTVDFRDVAYDFMSGKEYQFNGKTSESAQRTNMLWRITKQYMTDYEKWKSAFIEQ